MSEEFEDGFDGLPDGVRHDMQKCTKCHELISPLLVTSVVEDWDADDEQVDGMNEECSHLKEEYISSPDSVVVGWHICPYCKTGIGKPWIEYP